MIGRTKPKAVIYLNGKFYRHMRSLTGFNTLSNDYAMLEINGEIIFDDAAKCVWMSGRYYPEIVHCKIEPIAELGL